MRTLLHVLLFLVFIVPQAYAQQAVVARVNGSVLSEKDLDEEIDRMIPRSSFHGGVSEERRNSFREKALRAVIDRELQYQDAVAKGLKPDKNKVRSQMEEIRSRFRSKKDYRSALANAGLTEDELRAKIEKNVMVAEVTAKTVIEPAGMDDVALKDYYEKNFEKFKQPESVKLRLISTKDEKKAAEALAKIKAGEDFGAVAAAYSEDPYRVMGGDTGYQHKYRLLPEIERTVDTLKPGEMSGVFKTEKDWVIIKVEDKKPEQQMGYDDVKVKLKKDLEKKRANDILVKWLADLREKSKIEVMLKFENKEQKNEDGLSSKVQTTAVQEKDNKALK